MPNLISSLFGMPAGSIQSEKRDISSGFIPDVEANFLQMMGVDTTKIKVTSKVAMGISTFFSAVHLISDIIATQPWSLLQKDEEQNILSARDHTLHYLLHTRPNAQMSSFIFRKMMFMNMLVHGQAIAQIIKDRMGNAIGLRPFMSKDVQTHTDPLTGWVFFKIVNTNLVLKEEEVIHLKDVAFDGTKGSSILHWQEDSIKLPALAKAFSSKTLEKGAFMSGFVTAPLQAKDGEAAEIYKERIVSSLRGDNIGGFGLAVLGQGADYKPVTRSMADSSVIELFDQSDRDIAKAFRVPLVMLGDTTKSTSFGKGIDSMYILLVNNVIAPKVKQLEEETDYKCLTFKDQRDGYYSKMNLRSLLRGDAASFADYTTKQLQNGVVTQNEIRALDDLTRLEGGDRLWIQQNMMPMDRADEILDSKKNGTGTTKDADGTKVSSDSESKS